MDAFTDDQRALFEASAEVLSLRKGEFLLRRGEPGGDLFLLREGQLEAVDTRSTPEIILASMRPGKVVGEMSFLDGAPRSVDVRVGEDATVLRWAHRDLRALLRREPVFAAVFYESVAQLASERMRRLTDSAMTGSLLASEGDTGASALQARTEAGRLATDVKAALLQCETLLRESADPATEDRLRDVLFDLQIRLDALLLAWPEPALRELMASDLQRELHPYLVRSTLADRCIRRPQGITATPEILAQVLIQQPAGEGRLGEIVDAWILERPTLDALRVIAKVLPEAVGEGLPTHRNRRILVLNAGTGSLIANLGAIVGRAPTHITVVDPSRATLSMLDTDVAPMPANVTVEAVRADLAELAMGRTRHTFAAADRIVIHGLVEYLPDRLVVSLLRVAAGMLNPEGVIALGTLDSSIDRHLLDRLLRWPTLRRSPDTLVRLFAAAGLDEAEVVETAGPAVVLRARRPVASVRASR
jgi:CRP-like cAMP-binding protein/SAM-dependent methyltransferase